MLACLQIKTEFIARLRRLHNEFLRILFAILCIEYERSHYVQQHYIHNLSACANKLVEKKNIAPTFVRILVLVLAQIQIYLFSHLPGVKFHFKVTKTHTNHVQIVEI